jgi:hypothetical protein
MSRYIANLMYPKKSKRLIIWNGESIDYVLQPFVIDDGRSTLLQILISLVKINGDSMKYNDNNTLLRATMSQRHSHIVIQNRIIYFMCVFFLNGLTKRIYNGSPIKLPH